jgi:GNAT superfamily N-acetyltransferase
VIRFVSFTEALISVYRGAPCQVLPNALWKTLARAQEARTSVEVVAGQVTQLSMSDDETLYFYWHRERRPPSLLQEHLRRLRTALIHQDMLAEVPLSHLTVRRPFFRYIYSEDVTPRPPPPGFRFAPVHQANEAAAVADLIARCYPNLRPTPDEVRGWTTHPVYDPSLWLWVIDEATGRPAGLGIAEYDATVPEGSLEWIQVLPEYRGRGLGRSIVTELLSRLVGRADFVTVSGEAVNGPGAGTFYRHCGFEGDDIWWLLQDRAE